MSVADSSSDLQALYRDALSHHQAGRLAEASGLYKRILATAPRHAHSLQLLGLIAHQSGRPGDAVELIGRAIALKGDDPSFHLHMGLALKSLGRLDEAVASYDRALSLKPDFTAAHNNRAVALRAAGRMEAALAACERALAHQPDSAEAHSNRGDILKELGRLDEAVASYDRALALRPNLVITHIGRGNALLALGRHADAVASYDRALALRADDADCQAKRADALYAQRRLIEALAGYDRVLALKPDFVTVLHNRGNVLNELGRPDEAVASYDRAITLQPGLAATHNNRANVLRELGAFDLAIAGYDRAIALEPDLVEAHHNRGNVLNNQGRLEEAIASYDRALTARPDHAGVLVDRGTALKNLGRLDEAIASYERSLELGADYALTHAGLAEALQGRGRQEEALAHYERAIALKPNFALAHHGRGAVLGSLGKPEEALASYDRALEIDPESADTHNNRGNVLHGQGKFDQAMDCYDRAIALRPDFVTAHYNRANAFNNLGKFQEAVACYDRAIALKPDYAAAHCNRGVALRNLGLAAASTESFERAQALDPHSFEYASLAKLSLPIIMSSLSDIAEQRTRYRRGVADLTRFDGSLESLEATNSTYIFYLAYHGLDDRPILEEVGAMFRAKARSLTFEAPHIRAWQSPRGGRRIRIGFVSEFFREHTIEKLNRGFIRLLDRSRFEVVVLHAPQVKRDAYSDRLNGLADQALTLPPLLSQQQQAVAEQCLDVLFYPDIGMSKDTYFLAYARLAPVQVVSWGHPNTTGLESIDYFVSSDGAEPAGAETYYSEHLIRLGRLPCFYERPEPADATPSRKELGLPESGTLYGCPQSLFKFHPDFDPILAEIAAGDPDGHIVVIEGLHPTWNDLLRQRWARSHPSLLERILIMRRQPLNRFMALMSHFDVLLDPIHFGSGNTLYEAMASGTPVVTWPGRFMRGRIVAEAYRQMGVAGAPIARSLQDYAPLALALGRDPAHRSALRRTLREGAHALFEDRRAVREFETFIDAAVDAAGRGTRLPAGWRPQDRDGAPS